MRILLFILVAASTSQSQVSGFLSGRVLGGGGEGALANVEARVVVQRDGRDIRLSSGWTDSRGKFSIPLPVVPERTHLVLLARGFAPYVSLLTGNPHGGGVELGTIFLGHGRRLAVSLGRLPEASKGVNLRLCVPFFNSETVDCEGEVLVEAAFVNGMAALDHVPPGPVIALVTDDFASFVPRVLFWKMHDHPVELPPVDLWEGETLSVIAESESRGEGDMTVSALFGSGAWHWDSGTEWRMRRTASVQVPDENAYAVVMEHMPVAVSELRWESERTHLRTRHLPGSKANHVALRGGESLRLGVRSKFSGAPLPGARVQVGSVVVLTGDSGFAEIHGLDEGSYDVHVSHSGFMSRQLARLVVQHGIKPSRRDVRLARFSKIRGVLRGQDLKPIPGVLVAAPGVGDHPSGQGIRVFGRSDASGRFDIAGVPSGNILLEAFPDADGVPVPEFFQLSPANPNPAELVVGQGGDVAGRIMLSSTLPAEFSRVFLVSEEHGPRFILSPSLRGQIQAPRVYETLTGIDGRYSFRGVEVGRYHLVIRVDGHPQQVVRTLDTTVGRNTLGFDWTLGPSTTMSLPLRQGVAYRLRSSDTISVDRWIATGVTPVFEMNRLPEGDFSLSPFYPWGEPPRLSKKERPLTYGGHGVDPEALHFNSNRLPPGPAVVAVPWGRVTGVLSMDGKVPEGRGVELTAWPVSRKGGLMPMRLEADPITGEFEWALPRGVWMVSGRSPGFGEGWMGPLHVAIGAGREILGGLHLALNPPAALEGFVDPPPVEGGTNFHVSVRSARSLAASSWAIPFPARYMDSTGRFALNEIPSGNIEVEVAGPGVHSIKGYGIPALDRLNIQSWRPSASAELSALPDFADFGWSALQVQVGAWPPGPVEIGLEMDVPPGTYEVSQLEEFLLGTERHFRRRMALLDLGANASLLASLHSGEYRFLGAILINGKRWRFGCANLVPTRVGRFEFNRSGVRILTGAKGGFDFPGLEAGEYMLRLNFVGGDGRRYSHFVPVDVNPDGPRVFRDILRIETTPAMIRVVEPLEDAPLPGALVRLVRSDLRGKVSSSVLNRDIAQVAWGHTDSDGVVQFSDVPAGTYDVKIRLAGFGHHVERDVHFEKGRVAPAFTWSLPQEGGMSLSLKNRSSRSLADIPVFVFDSMGGEVMEDRLLTTDGDGGLGIVGLAPGRYRVSIQPERGPAQDVGEGTVNVGGGSVLMPIMEPGIDLVVLVQDARKNGIAGAEVTVRAGNVGSVLQPAGSLRTAERPFATDSRGKIRLSNVRKGPYSLEVACFGFQATMVEGNLLEGDAPNIVVEMKKNRVQGRTGTGRRR